MVSLKKKTKCILSPNSACVSGKLETSLPFSCVLSDEHSLPSPHCMHVAGGREKWHCGPHCYAGRSTEGWEKTEQRRIEQQRQRRARGEPGETRFSWFPCCFTLQLEGEQLSIGNCLPFPNEWIQSKSDPVRGEKSMEKGIQVSAMSESVGLKLYINIICKPQNALIPMDTAFSSLC